MNILQHDSPDFELISRCISGRDEEAWQQFVQQYSRLIWKSIHTTFRSSAFHYEQEDVEDAFSAIFLSLIDNDFKKLRQFHGVNSCSLSTWLVVVASHHTIDHVRRERRRSWTNTGLPIEHGHDVVDRNQDLESDLVQKQMDKAFTNAVDALPDQDKKVYDMLYARCCEPEKAAENLGISLPALYTRKHRLIEKLKKALPVV